MSLCYDLGQMSYGKVRPLQRGQALDLEALPVGTRLHPGMRVRFKALSGVVADRPCRCSPRTPVLLVDGRRVCLCCGPDPSPEQTES